MRVLLAFKNPSRPLNDTFELDCPVTTSIGELKNTLQGVYPGNPVPEAITLIYAGKVLKDNAMPLSAFISTDTSPVAIHIVVKGASTSTATSSSAVEGERPNSSASLSDRPSSRENILREQHPPSLPVAPASVAEAVVVPEVEPIPSAVSALPPASSMPTIPAPTPATQVNAEPRPTPPQTEESAASASTSKQQTDPQPTPAAGPQNTASSFPYAASVPPEMETFYSNQMAYGVAYQAAYQAALQSILSAQQQQQQQSGNAPQGSTNNNFNTQQMYYPMAMSLAAPPQPYYYNYPYQFNTPMMMPHPMQQQQMHPYQQSGGGSDEERLRYRRRAAAALAAAAVGPDGRVSEDLLRRLRELRNGGLQLPPDLVAALDRIEALTAGRGGAGAAGTGAAAVRPRVHRFQFRIQINIRALLQLAVLLVVVYQHCPPKRFAVLCLLGFALWLSTTPRVRAFLQTIAGVNNNRRGGVPEVPVPVPAPQPVAVDGQALDAAAAPAEAAPGAAEGAPVAPNADGGTVPDTPALDPQQPEQQPQLGAAEPRAGVLREIHAFVAGFITSLLPAMDQQNNIMNQDDGNAAGGGGGAMRDIFGGGQ